MSEYMARDFERASFARHEDGRVAMRNDDSTAVTQWQIGRYGAATDEDMATGGWVPVVAETGTRQDQLIIKAQQSEIDRLARRRDEWAEEFVVHGQTIADLRHDLALAREANLDLHREARQPLSLDALQAAWEGAEQADRFREGDVLIIKDDEDSYVVRRMDDSRSLDDTARILSRAPRPWQDLADDLQQFEWDLSPNAAARELHSLGWRKGGEEA